MTPEELAAIDTKARKVALLALNAIEAFLTGKGRFYIMKGIETKTIAFKMDDPE